MDTRIQFRVDEETKRIAQQMTESQGRTLLWRGRAERWESLLNSLYAPCTRTALVP